MINLSEAELQELIVEYLADHPGASDTVVGIAEWWVTRHQIKIVVSNLQLALDRLVQKGVLEALGDRDRRCYRLKR